MGSMEGRTDVVQQLITAGAIVDLPNTVNIYFVVGYCVFDSLLVRPYQNSVI